MDYFSFQYRKATVKLLLNLMAYMNDTHSSILYPPFNSYRSKLIQFFYKASDLITSSIWFLYKFRKEANKIKDLF